jgi:hypothetical protein
VTTIALLAALAAGWLQTDLPARTVDRGGQSRVDAPRQVVARTAAEWSALWRRHAAGRPAPPVDLSKEMVVAVFLGSRNTGGYAVDVVSVGREASGVVMVRYRERTPPRGAVTAQVITAPYVIIAIPQTADEISFERVP